MICGSRGSYGSVHSHVFPDKDEWRIMPDGTRTCSFCGSLHPDDFVDIAYGFVQGDGSEFSTTCKAYKIYACRPGTVNASQGGIKFYSWHDNDEASEDVEAAYRLAVVKMKAVWREKGFAV